MHSEHMLAEGQREKKEEIIREEKCIPVSEAEAAVVAVTFFLLAMLAPPFSSFSLLFLALSSATAFSRTGKHLMASLSNTSCKVK
jgi:hypothetical protein